MSTETLQQAAVWQIDAAHSTADFTVRHMVISKVRGSLRLTDGSIETAAGSAIPTAVKSTIDVASINTHEPDRDNHLRSGDFLDVAAYPTIEFQSVRITPKGAAQFEVAGSLTLHGVTREVVLEGEVDGQAKDPWGNERIAYSATAKINRKDFGMAFNAVLETGGVLVGEQVEIALVVQAIRQ